MVLRLYSLLKNAWKEILTLSEFYIHPSAEVAENTTIGKGTKIWHQVHIREQVVIGENCILSKGVYIDAGVTIGNHVKIQNGVSIYKGVLLEDEVYIGPNATFTNDMFPRSISQDWEVIPTILRKGASIGANATILCGVEINQYAMIAAGSVVTENVLPHALMIGSPARLKGFACACGFPFNLQNQNFPRFCFLCNKCGKKLIIGFELEDV